MATSPKKAVAKETAPTKKLPKKPGSYHNDVQLFKYFANLCQCSSEHGMTRVLRKNSGENNNLADGVKYIKKTKDCGKLHNPRVEAFDGIKFELRSD
jgi:hypothetical protein